MRVKWNQADLPLDTAHHMEHVFALDIILPFTSTFSTKTEKFLLCQLYTSPSSRAHPEGSWSGGLPRTPLWDWGAQPGAPTMGCASPFCRISLQHVSLLPAGGLPGAVTMLNSTWNLQCLVHCLKQSRCSIDV